MNAVKTFQPGISFESNTTYIGTEKEYHVYPEHAQPGGPVWYTTVTPQDPELLTGFMLKGLENVTVDLGGAKLVFHGRILPFALYDCKNVTLRNFSIDYDRPFYTQGTVVEQGKGFITLEIPEEFRYRVEKGCFIAVSDTWERNLNHGTPLFQPYDAKTQQLSKHSPMMLAITGDEVIWPQNPPCPVYQLRAEQLDGRKVKLTGCPDFFTPAVGDIVAFTHENRHKTGFQIERCEDTVLEDIRMLHISSLAVIANLCHNLTFRRFSCYTDEQTGERIICVNADILHGFHCTGHILVEDCRFENMLDDPLNFHGNYMLCRRQLDDHTFLADHHCAGLNYMEMYLPGDQINVFRASTQELKAVYTVESAEYVPGDGYVQKIVVRETVSDFEPDDIIESQRMAEMTIRRCTSGRCRGIWRISTGKKTLMEDCHMENSGVLFSGDATYWFENTGVRDVTVRNCVFEDFRGATVIAAPEFTPTAKAPYYHSGVKILNNRFVNCRGDILNLRNTTDVVLSGSVYLDDGTAPRSATLKNCSNVIIND